ncbi:MAG: glycosyltransferase, partial [Bacteroidia bacterium]
SGDVWKILEKKVKTQNLSEKIILINKIPKAELMHYTYNADLGISIDKNTNLNYYYSLPNKVFDYIHAGAPILASKMPEIENIINEYKIGDFINDHTPQNIANKINEMLNSQNLSIYKANTITAANELSWAKEKQKLKAIFAQF